MEADPPSSTYIPIVVYRPLDPGSASKAMESVSPLIVATCCYTWSASISAESVGEEATADLSHKHLSSQWTTFNLFLGDGFAH